ncbi:hypothetical protein H0H87_002862 [Tephrocybe sp. NHM501043]|nr:hypothetical protein H0H87_002862 [Tephrocybe sp. NHM501043]
MPSESTQSASGTPKTFEFTKRKRWADLLVTELADGIHVLLSPTCTILYCAPVITEILGWKSADLVDCDFLSLLGTRYFRMFALTAVTSCHRTYLPQEIWFSKYKENLARLK